MLIFIIMGVVILTLIIIFMLQPRARRIQIQEEEINSALSDFLFGCNLPFIIVESEYFKKFVRSLNPDYKLPSRKTVSSTILNKRYNKFKQSVINSPSLQGVLLLDGWKNSSANAKYEVAMLRLDDGQFIVLNSWDISSSSETAENLLEIVQQCKDIANDEFNKEIYAIITDNASNMLLTGRLSGLWNVSCNSHSGNLLCKSIINDHKVFSDSIHKLIKDFKLPRVESLLVRRGGNRMVIPGETRWCSYRDAYRRVLKNINKMKDVILHDDVELSNESRAFLFNNETELDLANHLLLLDPICSLIRSCEKNNRNIADATELWLKLELPVVNEEYTAIINQRLKKVINCYGLAANFLHPIYRGIRFFEDCDYVDMMNSFFRHQLSPQGLQELESYKFDTGMFGVLSARNYTDWNIFWKTVEPFFPELGKFSLKLLNIPASTGEIERLFSQWEYVHSKRRNRLTSIRSMKLASLYYTLRFREDRYSSSSDSEED